jgi:hypothetical protein
MDSTNIEELYKVLTLLESIEPYSKSNEEALNEATSRIVAMLGGVWEPPV